VRLDEDPGGRLERVATGAADEYERLAGEAG
jgi:hypothetical protein